MALLDIFDVRGMKQTIELDPLRERAPVAIGRADQAALRIDHDPTVSHCNAELTLVAGKWAIEDVGSRNGTKLNGDVLVRRTVLRDGDELCMGETTLGYRDYSSPDSSTAKAGPKPKVTLTTRERDVLVELCRPYFTRGWLKVPAERADIATRMFVGAPAVQAHLLHLYDKFGIAEGSNRRARLAGVVMDARIITERDYQDDDD
jgi:hypothetical protein